MHLEQHAVEEKAVGRGPAGRVTGQAAEDELLGARRQEAAVCACVHVVSLPWPFIVSRGGP